MTFESIKTYYLLDRWADAPENQGLGYVIQLLKNKGYNPSRDQLHHAIWLGLVDLRLLDPTKKSTPKDWKRAKAEYRKHYRHRIT